VLTKSVVAQEVGKSMGGEREDVQRMVEEVIAKLLPKITR
jgi:hypothetical protein